MRPVDLDTGKGFALPLVAGRCQLGDLTPIMDGEGVGMRRFRIEYRDAGDSGCPVFSAVWRGHDEEHAVERFLATEDADGWEIVKISEVKPS